MPDTRRIFVTGGTGFVGARLVAALRQRNEVVSAPDATELDVLDFTSVRAALLSANPDIVVHLAAVSHVPTCNADPARAIRINLAGTANVLCAMRDVLPGARLIFTGTAQVYAAPGSGEVAIDEAYPITPQNIYARTKWDAELLIADASRRDGLKATVLRLFNHTHRSQSPSFFLPHVYSSLLDGKSHISVGNIDLARDIGSVQDLTSALVAVLDVNSPYEVFNVCSGTAKSLRALACGLADRLGIAAVFERDPSKVREGEPTVICGSHERLTSATGWVPTAVTETTLLDAFLENGDSRTTSGA